MREKSRAIVKPGATLSAVTVIEIREMSARCNSRTARVIRGSQLPFLSARVQTLADREMIRDRRAAPVRRGEISFFFFHLPNVGINCSID